MKSKKIEFLNKDGKTLTGRLELPLDQHPHNFVIFAHCFTCSKNLTAVRNISRALSNKGFGVLRFDFTGLGESEGDFSDSNFSGNVGDLVQAAKYLEENYNSPSVLVGHSLGGAAVLFARQYLESVKAVVTIGSPANPEHVQHVLKEKIEMIENQGEATVDIGGRDFKIKKQFLDDIRSKDAEDVLLNLNAALLILHSPQDLIVGIKNAELLYRAAKHPKSFVTLDGADHLLSDKGDSHYTGDLIASWVSRYVTIPKKKDLKSNEQAVASLDAEDGFTTQMKAGNHHFVADEPENFGGNDYGPSPYDLVAAGLSACTAMTIQMYSKRKKWNVENVEVHSSHSKVHKEDCEQCEEKSAKIDSFSRTIKLEGDLDEKQRQRILEIANKCPVHRTLEGEIEIETSLEN